jgi:molybdopterin-biosynthesis enzyme MoeA-like protein
MDISIVVVGDEILSGHVQDANAAFIATRVAHHGHRLRRVVIISDDPKEIAAHEGSRRACDARVHVRRPRPDAR